MTAASAADQSWAPAGRVLARGQVPLGVGAVVQSEAPGLPGPITRGSEVHLGDGIFDLHSGRLLRLGDVDVLAPPLLDLWRAPTDNDIAPHGDSLVPPWRSLGLDRLRHRLVGVDLLPDALVVRHRVGAATTDVGFDVTYRWTAVGTGEAVGQPCGWRWPWSPTATCRARCRASGCGWPPP